MYSNQRPQKGKDFTEVYCCPLCGARYTSYDAKIVSEKEGAYLLHTNCSQCGSSVVVTLVANQLGISSVGLVTDLTFEDVVKFKDEERIEDNELLEAYNFLEEWDGELTGILYFQTSKTK